jgi:hypothetical protein
VGCERKEGPIAAKLAAQGGCVGELRRGEVFEDERSRMDLNANASMTASAAGYKWPRLLV